MTISDIKSPKVYVFDLDDTLFNNHEVDFRSFQTVLKRNRLGSLPRNRLSLLRKKGLTAKQIFEDLYYENSEKLTLERRNLLQRKDIWKYLKLNAGVKKTLAHIKSKNFKSIVLTKKESRLVYEITKGFGISGFIDKIMTSAKKKDSLKSISKRNVGAKIIFVSDSEDDLRAAKKVKGIKVFCFYNTYRDLKKMRKLAKVIYSLEEILE